MVPPNSSPIADKPKQLAPLVVLLPIHNLLGDGIFQPTLVSVHLRAVRSLLVFLGIHISAVKQLSHVLLIGGPQRKFAIGSEIFPP